MEEDQKENDLFYTCSLIEYIARKTKNEKKVIVQKLGKEKIEKIYNLAEVYHSEDIEQVSDEFIESCDISCGDYDIIKNCEYDIPSHFDIGKVYNRLILMISDNEEEYIDNLIKVLKSWIIKNIDNYNSSMYYENPGYIYQCFIEGKIL